MTHIHVSTPQDAEAAIREIFRQTSSAAIDIHIRVQPERRHADTPDWNYEDRERRRFCGKFLKARRVVHDKRRSLGCAG